MAEDNKEDNKEESTPKKANISKEILGNKVSIQGEEVEGSLSGIKSTIAGPNDTFIIEATVSKNEEGYQISGKGNYLNGPFEGEVSGIIQTDESFVPDESSLDVSGQVKVSKELSGIEPIRVKASLKLDKYTLPPEKEEIKYIDKDNLELLIDELKLKNL